MSRTARLFDLMQALRNHRRAVNGVRLAADLGISLRTLYRDIATLQSQGAAIDGAPGLGYVLRPGFTLPPLMFSVEEIEALALGSHWVAQRSDARLADAASHAMAKIAAVLPGELRHLLDSSTLLAGPASAPSSSTDNMATLREAIRSERKLRFDYQDAKGQASQRTVWPFALGYFDRVQVLVAWCELRQDQRHFRCDRMAAVTLTDERLPQPRLHLLREWRKRQNIGASTQAKRATDKN